jgi:hypothetical protein
MTDDKCQLGNKTAPKIFPGLPSRGSLAVFLRGSALACGFFDFVTDESRDKSGAGQFDTALAHLRDQLFASLINKSDLRQIHADGLDWRKRMSRFSRDRGVPAAFQFRDPGARQLPRQDDGCHFFFLMNINSKHRFGQSSAFGNWQLACRVGLDPARRLKRLRKL